MTFTILVFSALMLSPLVSHHLVSVDGFFGTPVSLILNVSEKFIENVGGVGFLLNDTWAKWGFEIW